MRFVEFKKIPRLSREVLVTEKLDGTNAQIVILPQDKIIKECEGCNYTYQEFIDKYCLYVHPENPHVEEKDKLYLFAASRNRWLSTGKENDNHAFAYWVKENALELIKLGIGRHFGEWYGKGINRGYGLDHKRFALFNVSKWAMKDDDLIEGQSYCPSCCEVVPTLYEGVFDTTIINNIINVLKEKGSVAVIGFMNPEGVCIYHEAAGQYFKKTIEGDEKPKGKQNA